MPYCDDIVKALLELLQSQELNRRVKPAVLSTFSDIALALNGDFQRYASVVLLILQQVVS
jgi:importin subunit beta-1